MNIDARYVTSGAASGRWRKSGIDCLGELPWGSHICQLYASRADLLEVLVPYFEAGLLSNEYCIWITSDALPKAEAIAALRAEVPWLDRCVAKGQIDILDCSEWYLAEGGFDGERVCQAWARKLEAATARGFDGMRLSGDTYWLGAADWESFVTYEARLDPVIVEGPILALCTYALEKMGAKEVFDAIANHELALVREGGAWSSFKSFARHRTERLSRENEARLGATIDGASDEIVTVDVHGSILLANAAARQMFGYEPHEIPAVQIGALVPDLWDAGKAGEASERLRRQIGASHEGEGRRKDNTTFPIEWTLRTTNANEQQLFVGCIRDLTRQREAEERIRKLHADRVDAIGGMATALAHELNQPLAATTTYLHAAQRLLRMPSGVRPASLEKTLAAATEQALRAGRILKHIREFVVRGEPDKSVCSIHQLINDACILTQESAKQVGVEISFNFRAVDDSVVADRIQIVQVIVNLMRNAVDAMRETAERKLELLTSSDGATVRVAVKDTGHGVSQTLKARLFEPFATSKANGMGVGLSVSRSIIEAHHGEMSVSEAPGGGAIASFTLPLATNAMT